eukprot:791058-Pyramimonas_sp.AAC.1
MPRGTQGSASRSPGVRSPAGTGPGCPELARVLLGARRASWGGSHRRLRDGPPRRPKRLPRRTLDGPRGSQYAPAINRWQHTMSPQD